MTERTTSTHQNNKGSIPLIDFSPFLVDEGVVVGQAPTAAQRAVAQQLDQVNRQHGFLALQNFGLSALQRNQAFAEAAQLFALPDDFKRQQLTRIQPATNMGYASFCSQRLNQSRPPDLMEAFNVRFPPLNVNPLTNCPETFGPFVEGVLLPTYQTLAARFALACAVALDIPQVDFFARHLQQYDLCTLRFLHYPPCDAPADDDTTPTSNTDGTKDVTKTSLRIGEHTDFGAFTFLLVHPDHGPAGLQIKSVAGAEVGGTAAGEDEGWQNVVLPTTPVANDDSNSSPQPVLIVNTGALLARWTNDAWKATAHRVIVPDAATAAQSRYSIACFIDPDTNSMIQVHPSFEAQHGKILYPPIKSSDYLAQKLQALMSSKVKS